MLEKLEDRIVELSEKLEGLTVEHGEQAVELAASVAQAEAIHSLLWPPFLILPALGLAKIGQIFWKKYKESGDLSCWDFGAISMGVLAGVVGSGGIIGSILNLTSVVLWRAAFDPYFALAAEVLGKL